MTNLSKLVILSSYGDLITTSNSGQGLNTVLEYLQDGLGHSSPLQLATNAFNIDRTVGTFQLDTVAITAQAIYINEVCQPDPTMPGTGGMVVPTGTTGQRNSRNGTIRYNSTTHEMEYYVNNAWMTVTGTGDVTGPGGSVAGNIPTFADNTGKLLDDSGVQIGALALRESRSPSLTDLFLIGLDGIDFNAIGQVTIETDPMFIVYQNSAGHCPVSMVVSDTAAVNTNNSALLELASTKGAFLLSRMTTTQMNALIPANGMVIYNTTQGLVYAYQTGSWAPIGEGGSVTSIAAVSNSAALTITGSPITSTGTFTFTLDPDLEGLYLLSTTGLISRTGSGTYATRTITGTANQITLSNGDGVSGNPTISLASNITGITSATIGDLHFATNVISSVNSNENIVLTPNGTGIVTTPIASLGHLHFATNVISSVNSNENIVLTPNGTGIVTTPIATIGDIHIATNIISSTGANENIVLSPSGTGIVTTVEATIGDLNILTNTLSSINADENIIISPNGTGISQVTSEFDILNSNSLRFYDSPNTFYVGFQPPSLTGSTTYTLPSSFPGVGGQVLTSDPSGNLSWTTNTSGVTNIQGTADQINVISSGTVFTISLSDNPVIPGIQSMTIPVGLISDRPSIPQPGMIRYNDTFDYLEAFVVGNNFGWHNIVTADKIIGTDGQIITAEDILTGNVTIGIDPIFLSTIDSAVASAVEAAGFAKASELIADGAASVAAGAAASASASAIAAAASATAAAAAADIAVNAEENLNAALNAPYILQEVTASLPNAQSLGLLTTGMLKNNTAGAIGTLSIGIAGTDYYSPGHPTTIIDTGLGGNFFIGTNAGNLVLSGIGNVGTGYGVLFSETTGSNNTSYGYQSLTANTTGGSNSAFGYQALTSVSTVTGLSAFGYQALSSNSSGTGNGASGYQSLKATTTGSGNTGTGYQSLTANLTGSFNSAFGYQTISTATAISGLSAFGYQALTLNSTGTFNSAFGYLSLSSTDIGASCCAFGYQSLTANTSGQSNSAFGYRALATSTTVSGMSAFGTQALELNSSGVANSAFGFSSLSINTSGSNNSSFGYQSLSRNTNGSANSAFGFQALTANAASAINNSAFGYQGLAANTSGTDNSSFGYQALSSNLTGSFNCAFGYQAVSAPTAVSGLSGFGYQSLTANSSGLNNSAFGYASATATNTGGNNAAFGYNALLANTSASFNCAFGSQALASSITVPNQSAFGYQALTANLSGTVNSAFGYQSLATNTAGSGNSAFGHQSLNAGTGNFNCAFGYQSISSSTAQSGLSAFGYQSLHTNSTGTSNSAFGYLSLTLNADGVNNSAFGYQSMQTCSSGASNSSFGMQSLNLLTSGGNNSAFGYQSLQTITSANYNSAFGYGSLSANTSSGLSAFGYQALSGNTSGTNNASFGYQSLTSSVSGSGCSAFGYSSFATMTSGSNNTGIGYNSGQSQTTYNNCTFLGYSADASANTLTNAAAIGYNASVATSNSMVLGNGANVGIGTSSPVNKLHIVGTYQQKGITSGWTGTDLVKGQVSIQTTNNTITTILTVPVPTSPNTAIFVKADIVCMLSTGLSSAYGQSFQGAWYNGTTTATIGTAATITLTNSGTFAVAAAWSVSGNNLLLRVTGIAASNINWVVNYEYFAATTSTA